MFKFLKEKLGKAIASFSKKAEDEGEKVEETIEPKVEKLISEPPVKEPKKKPEPVKKPKSEPKKKPEPITRPPKEESVKEEPKVPEAKPEEKPVPKEEPKAEAAPVKEEPEKKEESEEKPAPKDDLKEEAKKEPKVDVPKEEAPVKEEPKLEPEPITPSPKEESEPISKPEPKKSIWKRLIGRKEPEPITPSPKEESVKEEPKAPEAKQEEKPVPKEEPKAESVPVKEEPEKKEEPEEKPTPKEEPKEEPKAEPEKKGIFQKFKEKVTKTVLKDDKFDELFWDIEMILLENNVAVEVIEKIKEDLKAMIVGQAIPRGKMVDLILSSLKRSITELLETDTYDIFKKMEEKKPFVVCFIGINGSGKTTTIAKIAKQLKDRGKEVVLAASDTFRAAAIDQLAIHAEKVGAKIIKHDYGSDAAAVAFDAVEHAKSKGKDIVLIDTAGRMHSNSNLMDELKKVVRVADPDLKIFVGESITGNDCVEQAKKFDEAVGIDGLILTKADIDEKGGAALSISYVTKKPILLIGMGQEYDDLQLFKPSIITDSLGI